MQFPSISGKKNVLKADWSIQVSMDTQNYIMFVNGIAAINGHYIHPYYPKD